jgi:hypothetical protein
MLITVLELTLVAVLCATGMQLIRTPEVFLEKFGRPTTEKHIRATRLIGCFFFAGAFAMLIDWIRFLSTSN